ncbi:MAG: sugar transferase [Acidobacteria bacterium]|nr:MAG: sugar transferase [Acidobacteriota bacterium]
MSSQVDRIGTSGTLAAPRILPYPHTPVLSLKAQRFLLRSVLSVSDIVTLAFAFRLAFWFRFDLGWTVAPEVVPDAEFYPTLIALLVPLWVAIFILFRLYDPHLILGGIAEYSRTFNACTAATMFVILATFIEPRFVVSRFWVVSAWALSFVLIAATRFFWRRVAYGLRSRGFLLIPAVIVGTNEEAEALASDLGQWRSSGLRILGFVASESRPSHHRMTLPVLGSLEEIREIVQDHDIEDLVVSITALNREELLSLCESVNNLPDVHLRLSSGLYELLTTRVSVQTLGTVPLISMNKIRLAPQEVYVKTLLDYVLALAGLIVLSPLLIVIALLIRFDSPGPVFYRRRVLGVGGSEFDAFKFRTMRQDGDAVLSQNRELAQQFEANHKLKEDPRVTRVGRWLRKYSLDELPQLFNVLLGQMGLVGPRMICPAEGDKYGRHKVNLLTVKPGITGLWQVSGRSDLTYEERVRLDMYYIRHYSLWLDLQILFVQTLPAVMKSRGAY